MSPRRLVLWVSALRAEDPRDRGQSEDMGSAAGLLPGATSSLSQALPRPVGSRGPHCAPPWKRPCCKSISVQATFQYCSPGPGVERRHE